MALRNHNGTWTLTHGEYQELKKAADLYYALEAVGVDNWEGYSDAWRIVEGEITEDGI